MTSATTLDESTNPGRSGRWTVALFALVGLGLGLLYFTFRTPTYEAEALVNVANPVGPLADQVNVANSREILNAAASAIGYEPQVTISAAEVSQLLTIVGTAPDPQEAADSANAVANTYVQAQLGPPATIALPAQAPESPVGLGPLAFAAIGTGLGAAFGMLMTALQARGTARRKEAEAPARTDRERTRPRREPGVGDVAAAAKEVGWDATQQLTDLDRLDATPTSARSASSASNVGANAGLAAADGVNSDHVDADLVDDTASSFAQLSGMATLDKATKKPTPARSSSRSGSSSLWSPEIEVVPATERATELVDLSESPPPDLVEPAPAEFIDLRSLDTTSPAERAPEPVSTTPQPAEPAAPAQPAAATPIPPQPTPPPAQPAAATPIPPQPTPPPAQPAAATPQPPPPGATPEPIAPANTPVPAAVPAPQLPPLDAQPPAAMPTSVPEQPANTPVPAAVPAPQLPPLDAQPPAAMPASVPEQPAPAPSPEAEALTALERQSIQAKLEAALYQRSLAHEEELAHLRTEHEHQTASLTAEVASLNKKLRVQTARLKNRTGTDQNRVGDLEAQLAAVESDLVEVKETLENERIAHTKRVTEQRGVADRALDNARRQYREELAKHVHTHRSSLADHRDDLDRELAEDRARQASALEQEHHQYEVQLEAERARSVEREAAANERHDKAMARLREETQHKLDTQMEQHRETVATLRTTNEDSEQQVLQLERDNRALRAELSSQRKQTHETQIELQTQGQRLSDELVLMRSELDGERERNAALRADVLRRSAEAHQAIDRAVEERTAQLAELEATVERQREYADRRVSEMSAAAEEQARQAAVREADLTAQISRLRREIETGKPPTQQ